MFKPTIPPQRKHLREFITAGGRSIQAPPFKDHLHCEYLGRELASIINPMLPPNVCGWRTGGSVAVAVNKIHALPGHRTKFDIQQFFPSINQERMKRKLDKISPFIWEAIEPWLTPTGLPTGVHCSPALGNLYMLDIDLRFPNAIRYCDNVMIVDADPERVFMKMQRHLSDIDLVVHEVEYDPSEFCKTALRPPKIAPSQNGDNDTEHVISLASNIHVGDGV
jgi:hypothetical protein